VSDYEQIRNILGATTHEAWLSTVAESREKEHEHVMRALAYLANAQELLEALAKSIERAGGGQ